jgi:hypothetical protein
MTPEYLRRSGYQIINLIGRSHTQDLMGSLMVARANSFTNESTGVLQGFKSVAV